MKQEEIRKFKVLLGLEQNESTPRIIEILSKSYLVQTVIDTEDAYHHIHSFDPDLAILDYSLSKLHPINLHEGISFVHASLHLVICVTEENLEVAHRVWNRRAIDFILKPYTVDRFIHDVNKVVRYVLERRELDQLRKRINILEREMKQLREKQGPPSGPSV